VGTSSLGDGWELFGELLGGAWAYGGDSPGFWWGQLQFSAGPKVELLTPTGGADAAFLERFLAARGPGFHHLNFLVPAIEVTLGKIDPAWERWTPDPDAPADERLRGGYRWRVALPAGSKRTLRAGYEVKIAGKLELVGGNRRES